MKDLEEIHSLLEVLLLNSRDPIEAVKALHTHQRSLLLHNEKDDLIQKAESLIESQDPRTEEFLLFLCTIDSTNVWCWTQLGVCKMKIHEYDSALKAFGTASIINSALPLPYLLSAACYAHCSMKEQVTLCLELCMERSMKSVTYKTLYETASYCHHDHSLLTQLFL